MIVEGSAYRHVAQGGERYPDTVEVVSSNLTVPTINYEGLWQTPGPFLFCYYYVATNKYC